MKMLDSNSDMYRIVGCAFAVYNTLKAGYLESVYEKALEWELLDAGFSVRRQVRIPVFYNGVDLKRDFYASLTKTLPFTRRCQTANLCFIFHTPITLKF